MTVKKAKFEILAQEAADENTTQERLEELITNSIEIRRIVASNPACSPELLAILAKSKDTVVCQNITANPNTPLDVLFELLKKFPEQFLQNPIVTLLLLEDLNSFNKIPLTAVESLLEYLLNQLEIDKDRFVETNEAFTTKFYLQKLIKYQKHSIPRRIASHHLIPIDFLEELASHPEEFVRRGVATNISTPLYLLEKLSKDDSSFVKEGVARNKNTTLQILQDLVDNDETGFVAVGITLNHNAPACILSTIFEKLKGYREYAVVNLAISFNLTAYALEKLAVDERWKVRKRLVNNIDMTPDLLRKMAQRPDEKWMVLKEIANHIKTPIDVLSMLACDRRKTVRECATANLTYRQLINCDRDR